MKNTAVAEILEEMGTLMELKGENPFKCRAYHNAARIISALTDDVEELVRSDELESVKGIGKGLGEAISEYLSGGTIAEHQKLKKSLPPGLLEMLRIQGLGPKKVKALYERLKITSVDELERAAADHRLARMEGFGEKTEENILKGIEQLRRHASKHLYPEAQAASEAVAEALRRSPGVHRCEVAGSIRRRKETIGDIDILVSARRSEAGKVMEAFTAHPDVAAVVANGETKSSVTLRSSINCDLRVVSEKEFPFALAYFTGSKEHNIEMRSRAKTYGWSLNEYGFSAADQLPAGVKAKTPPRCRSEEDIFRALGLAYVPPELREATGEIEAAASGTLPRLIEEKDIRGTFHCHTNYSDGRSTLEQMAKAARELGWEYIGIADHSKSAAYARGLSEERVKQQLQEIDTLNKGFRAFTLLKGTEVDILPDGTLDFCDAVLARFDYVVASVHSKFTMTEAEATKRIITALKNKHVTMLGHPTGRLLLERDGYPVNMTEVIDAAADYGKLIEINAHPLRLDLDWRRCKYAREKHVMIAINPDAHETAGLMDVRYGVGTARKGWLEKKDVINTWGREKVLKYLSTSHS